MNFLGKNSSPMMLVGEPDSWILSIVFLNEDSKLLDLKIDLPDRPGALYEIMRAMGEESINVLAGYTNVLVYFERMTCDLVIDVRSFPLKAKEDLRDYLKKRIADLGPQFSLVDMHPIKL
jgi:hypothetical protein